jgi:myo-inositol 2-dehydrogenase / D-chiro-inositol 1-dehydrogenase
VKPVRLGFVGLGHITVNAHLPALAELAEAGEVVLQAFCDTSEEVGSEQARVFGAKAVYTDHRSMFDKEELDAVYLCIPPTLHTDAEYIAAEKGVAVFIEKPQTLDMAQAVAFNKAFEESGILTQVGFMSRYYEASSRARDILAERTPRHASVQLWYSGKHIRLWTSRVELCGGSFVENTIHMVDLLRYLLGDIRSVSAFYHDRKPGEGPEPINMPHVYNVNYRFESGVVANATTSRVLTNVGASRREVSIVSDDSLMTWSQRSIEENGETMFTAPDGDNAFASQAKAFVKAVGSGDAGLLRSPYSDALNSLAAVLAANVSAGRGGEVIDLKAFEEGKVT